MKQQQDEHRKCGSSMSRDDEIVVWFAIAICLFTVFM
jgi:hypothetical protein